MEDFQETVAETSEEGLRVTFAETFYSQQVAKIGASENVQVELRDTTKGKELRAKKAFEKGDTLFEERHCVAVRNGKHILKGPPVCGMCLRSLETPYSCSLRIRKEQGGELGEFPYFESCLAHYTEYTSQHKVEPVKCEKCDWEFCSQECYQACVEEHHGVLCAGERGVGEGEDPVVTMLKEKWEQRGIDFIDTVWAAIVMIATALNRAKRGACPSIREAWVPFGFFISRPWQELEFDFVLKTTYGNDFEPPPAKPTPDEVVARASEHFKRILSPPPEGEFLFEPSFISRLFGAILLNGQQRIPLSPFALYRSWLHDKYPDELADVLETVCGTGSTEEHWSTHNVSGEGQGIYSVGACMNHSCSPNAKVIYSERHDETLVVQARRKIEPGEEICISYLTSGESLETRQAHLSGHYRFDCRCPKCERQIKEKEEGEEEPPPPPEE